MSLTTSSASVAGDVAHSTTAVGPGPTTQTQAAMILPPIFPEHIRTFRLHVGTFNAKNAISMDRNLLSDSGFPDLANFTRAFKDVSVVSTGSYLGRTVAAAQLEAIPTTLHTGFFRGAAYVRPGQNSSALNFTLACGRPGAAVVFLGSVQNISAPFKMESALFWPEGTTSFLKATMSAELFPRFDFVVECSANASVDLFLNITLRCDGTGYGYTVTGG